MLFSSLIFIYLFLPFTLIFYYLINPDYRNRFLLVTSLVFFAWGGVSYSFLLLFSLILNFFIGKAIGTNSNRFWLIVGVSINLIFLLIFKYANFFAKNFAELFQHDGQAYQDLGIVLPIGISFYTFQAISYLIDVYRRTTEPQKKFVNLALYISFFPQLIAGPIVRYHDIAKQLVNRSHSRASFIYGVERFVLGLAKKVLIANQFALIADNVFAISPDSLGTFTAWIGIIAYSFQIYFDFSAYSDMAIGLGRMFGFKFLENFNFPYIAKSIREFWYRWHISLSNWFRDYLYISLGGNRKGTARTYLNLFIVFLITGFWHGASWTFIVWGLIHGLFMIIEKLGFDRILEKLWSPLRYFYTLLVVVMAWVVFRAETFDEALGFYHSLFVYKSSDLNADVLMNFFNVETYIVAIIALLGSARVFTLMGEKMNILQLRFSLKAQKNMLVVVDMVELIAIAFVMLMVSMYLVAGTYNPFIYFRF